MSKTIQLNPWDAARSIPVVRGGSDLEPGVKYFVLMLEKLGAVTHYSCEGHPRGFYIVFDAPHELAKRIERCGYLEVAIFKGGWSMHFGFGNESRIKTQKYKNNLLRSTAEAWQRAFGLFVHGCELMCQHTSDGRL